MSTIHMIEQVVNFRGDSSLSPGFLNKLTTNSSIIFPSNIINCSLTVKDFSFGSAHLNSQGVFQSIDVEPNSLGWGVKNINHLGPQVFFTGWMQVLYIYESNKTVPDPTNSYLSVLAIAQCE